jgi:hypothetical protein
VFDESGFDRITFHVANCVPEMGVSEDTGEEAFLPKVSVETVLAVEVGGVCPVQIVQTVGNRLSGRRYGHVMNVVGHQAVSVETKVIESAVVEKS